MFSAKLERRRRIHRWAVIVAATVLACGLALIAIWAAQAYDMLGTVEAGLAPVILSVLIALAGLLVLCFGAYTAVRVYGRLTSR
jgi:polyferredoxin